MDHADAKIERVLGGADVHGLAVYIDLPAVGIIDAGEHIHQRGFTAAVLSQKGEDLSTPKLKVHRVVGDDLAEALGDLLHLDRSYSFQKRPSFLPKLA